MILPRILALFVVIPTFSMAVDPNKAPDIGWEIDGTASPISLNFASDNIGPEIVVSLDAPASTTAGVTREVRMLKSDCVTETSDLSPSALTGDLNIEFNIDPADLPTMPDVFDGTTGTFSMCMEVQYKWEGTPATHRFVTLSFVLDTDEGFAVDPASINLQVLTDLTNDGGTIETNYIGDAYHCPTACGSESPYPPLPQGASFSICVDTDNAAGVYVATCSAVAITQANYNSGGSPITGHTISNALDDIFTTMVCGGGCCRITTILDQRWFSAPGANGDESNPDTPGSLTITGECSVGFGAYPSRHLRNLLEGETESQNFGATQIDLKSDNGNSAADAKTTSAAMLAAGAGLVVAAML